jgi:hypothetical protein
MEVVLKNTEIDSAELATWQNITADDNPFLCWAMIFSYDYFSQHILRHNHKICDLPFCHNEAPLQNLVVARGAFKGGSNNLRGSLLVDHHCLAAAGGEESVSPGGG